MVTLLLICCKQRKLHLTNLTKHHKESEENSYTSSKRSRESWSISPDPEYDVIKVKVSVSSNKAVFKRQSDVSSGVYASVSSSLHIQHTEEKDSYNTGIYSTIYSRVGDIVKTLAADGNQDHSTTTSVDAGASTHEMETSEDYQIGINEDNKVDNKHHIYAEINLKTKKRTHVKKGKTMRILRM